MGIKPDVIMAIAWIEDTSIVFIYRVDTINSLE